MMGLYGGQTWDEYTRNRIPHEIAWIQKQLDTKKLSQKNIKEYRHQIRHMELELAFLDLGETPTD